MRVKILESDERLRVKKGEIYKAERYHLDPFDKVSLLSREGDGYDPECNQYVSDVAFWMDEQWMVVKDNKYVPETV